MSLIDFLKEKRETLDHLIDEKSKDVRSEVLTDVEQGLQEIRQDVGEAVGKIKTFALDNADKVFAILRVVKPILVYDGKFALVTRFTDAQDVLSHDDVFHTLYPEKLAAVGGISDGSVGRPNTPAHMRDIANMQIAFRRDDIATRAVPFIRRHAADAVTASGGRLDVVGGLFRVVPPRWISRYTGVPDPSPGQVADWSDDIFRYVFTDITNDPAVAGPSLKSASQFRRHVDSVVAGRKKNRGGDDVLERFLEMQDAGIPGMDDDRMRATLMIFFYGTVTLTARASALAVDELLRRPDTLAKAQEAARAGNTDLVGQYVWEALRFNAVNPGLFRTAAEDYVVAKGDSRATRIPKGTMVFSALQSAMLDGHEIDDPEEFRLGRPWYQYMHFGYGLHQCFGRYLSYQQVPVLVESVLKQQNLRRAPGAAGELQVEGGIFPIKMVVEFDP